MTDTMNIYDPDLDLVATIKTAIADTLDLVSDTHSVLGCLDPQCYACAALLCPHDSIDHLEHCPWAACQQDHAAAVIEALQGTRLRAAAAEAVGPPPPPSEPPPPVPPAVVSALYTVWPFLNGLQAGAALAGRDVAGLSGVLVAVQLAVASLGPSPVEVAPVDQDTTPAGGAGGATGAPGPAGSPDTDTDTPEISP